jgi:CRISPR/Cas system-associated exonuclease Cas4 (RecB family)
MNEQNIEDIISALYDMVQDARALPLGADKCILVRDKVLDMLDEIIAQLPVELKQSRTIVESRNELIGQARREAENLIRQAQEKAAQLVAEEAIYQEAKRQCQEMVLQTQARMAELRKASNDYMDDALRRTEEAIAISLEDVRDTRTKFKALVEAQEKRAAAPIEETDA